MRKWIAAILALVILGLTGTFSRAEEIVEVRWANWEAWVQENGIPAEFHTIGDTGVSIWMPDLLRPVELTEEEKQSIAAFFETEDGSGYVLVTLMGDGTKTSVPDLIEEMRNQGLLPVQVDVNGMNGVACLIPDSDAYSLMVMYDTGRFLSFIFNPVSDDMMNPLITVAAASIRKEGLVPPPAAEQAETKEDIPALSWEKMKENAGKVDPNGKLFRIGDLPLCMWTPSIFTFWDVPEGKDDWLTWMTTADNSASIIVTSVSNAGFSLEDWRKALISNGYTDVELVTVNGMPAVAYYDAEEDTLNVMIRPAESTESPIFTFWPVSDEGFAELAGLMISSIQPFTVE